MTDFFQTELFEGGRFLAVNTQRFKTTRITVRFAVDLKKETAASFAAVPGLLRYTSAKYPTNIQTERKLASLYGAGYSATVGKYADVQIMSFTISAVADKFAFENEKIGNECLSFLLDSLFCPDLDENGLIKEFNLEREKRLMREEIQADMNDKMSLSLNRFSAEFYEGEGAALLSSGSLEDIDDITVESVTKAWKSMLSNSEVFIVTVGDTDNASYISTIKKYFEKIDRKFKKPVIVPHSPKEEVKKVNDIQPLEQCKLNIGFSCESDDSDAGKLFNSVFGGSEMSLLSKVVREKMSLCYYCSSSFGPKKKVLIVFSGVESENREKTLEAVLEQLQKVKKGEVDDEQISIAKRKLKEAYMSFDTPIDISRWYLSQMFESEIKTPERMFKAIESVGKERITAFAQSIKPDTVYSLGDK